jgi:hypothetical protein
MNVGPYLKISSTSPQDGLGNWVGGGGEGACRTVRDAVIQALCLHVFQEPGLAGPGPKEPEKAASTFPRSSGKGRGGKDSLAPYSGQPDLEPLALLAGLTASADRTGARPQGLGSGNLPGGLGAPGTLHFGQLAKTTAAFDLELTPAPQDGRR